MSCDCGLRGEHFACAQCGIHAGLKSMPCISCHGFRFTASSQELPVAELAPVAPAHVEQAQHMNRRDRRRAR